MNDEIKISFCPLVFQADANAGAEKMVLMPVYLLQY